MVYREMDSTKAGFFHMASSSWNHYLTVDSDSTASPRVNRGGLRSFGPSISTESTRRGEWWRKDNGQMMDKVKRNSIVLLYIAVVVTILLLMMLGVI